MRSLIVLVLILTTAFELRAQEKYTFVFLHTRPDAPKLEKEESDKIMAGHMDNINKMAKEGKLLAAGPFEGGGGLFVFKSSSTAEVTEWMSSDPGVKANRWNIEMLPYEPKIGGICTVSEPYEMTMYTFVHFKPKVFKFNVQEAGQTVEEHNKFVRELAKGGNVVTHALFGGIDGAILVMKGDLQQEVILADPAVKGALFEPEFKKLYIAKGSFCEK
ncbi:MAG TPA: YciI family protein [Cyclobacteriaceae bacterium]|nr:YciI family protein [Cyclobacteriaceae bacterium]